MFMDKNILYMYIVWDGYLYLCIICMVLKYLKKIMFLYYVILMILNVNK